LPLGSGGQRRPESEAVERCQLAQDAAFGRQNQTYPQGDMASSQGAEGGCGGFPVLHHLGEEVGGGRHRFVLRGVSRGVPPNGTCRHHPRGNRVLPTGDLDQSEGINAAGPDARLDAGGPPLGDGFAGEVNEAIDTDYGLRVELAYVRVPMESADGNAAQFAHARSVAAEDVNLGERVLFVDAPDDGTPHQPRGPGHENRAQGARRRGAGVLGHDQRTASRGQRFDAPSPKMGARLRRNTNYYRRIRIL
jgi:hypothetical protein